MAFGFAPHKKFKEQTLHTMFVNNLLDVQPTTCRERGKLLLLDVRLGAAAVREARSLQWLGSRAGMSHGGRLLRLYNLDPLGFLQLSDAWLSKRGPSKRASARQPTAPAPTATPSRGAACRNRPSPNGTPSTVAKIPRCWRQISIADALIVMRRNADLGQPSGAAHARLFE